MDVWGPSLLLLPISLNIAKTFQLPRGSRLFDLLLRFVQFGLCPPLTFDPAGGVSYINTGRGV